MSGRTWPCPWPWSSSWVLSELEACGLGCEHWADPDPGLPISHWPARIMRMAPAIHTQAGAINAGFYKILKDIR